MPVSAISTFNPEDEDSWFFGIMSRDEATRLLSQHNEKGAFLVRESITAKGDLVLSVKESDEKVSHYIINRIPSDKGQQVCFKIGEQLFSDIPALLTYYKLNNLDDTPLKGAATPKDTSIYNRSFTRDYLAEVQSESANRPSQVEQKSAHLQRKLPGLAEVIQSRIPNAYDKTALTLKKGDIIRVTKMDISGCWEGEISGRRGHFPFNYVRFIEDSNSKST